MANVQILVHCIYMAGPEKEDWRNLKGWARVEGAEKEVQREERQEDLEVSQDVFYESLKQARSLTERFRITDGGFLEQEGWAPEITSIFEFISAERGEGAVERKHPVYTPDEVYRAAKNLTDRYPDVQFEFHPDPAGRTFSYTARIIEKKAERLRNSWQK